MADAWRGKDPDLPWEDDDDEEEPGYFNLLLQNLVANFFENLHLENNIYLVKDAMPLFNYIMTQAGNYHDWNPTFRFIMGWDQDFLYSNNNLIYAGGENIAKGVAQIYKKLTKGDEYDKSWYDIVQKTGSGVGTFIGVPIGTLMRDFKPIIEKITLTPLAADGTEEDTESFVKTVMEKLGGSKKAKIEEEADTSESSVNKEELPDYMTDEQKEEIVKAGEKRTKAKEKKKQKDSSGEEIDPAYRDKNDMRFDAEKAAAGYEGEERNKRIWQSVSTGYKNHIMEGDFGYIAKMRAVVADMGGDLSYFDAQVMETAKTAMKKTLEPDGADTESEMVAQQNIKEYILTHGGTEAELSEMVYKSATAKDLKVAFRINDEMAIRATGTALVRAGLSSYDYERLYKNRNRMDLKKYTGKYKDRLKSTGRYVWPTQGTITSEFGYRNAPTAGASSYHQAIDIGAPTGTPVVAADGGVVIFSGWHGASGKRVAIKHDDGTITYYNHLSWWNANVGDTVAQGAEIGQVGSTGVSTGPHLDFRVEKDGKLIDPMKYLQEHNG